MDTRATTGGVYLQSLKAKDKWKPVCLSLLPSSSEAARLEIQDMGGWGAGAEHPWGLRRHHEVTSEKKPKVIPLSEILNAVRLPPNAEACPMENMSAFCVETTERTIVFAASKDKCVHWVDQLCPQTCQRVAANQLQMEENLIYASADEDFWVSVQQTDAAVHCGLKGSYWLQVGEKALLLKDLQKKVIWEWPYEWLRRYGTDKLALTIEAGRRCVSGPGSFNFETPDAAKVFSLMKTTIKHRSSSVMSRMQKKEEETGTSSIRQTHSPLPRIPDKSGLTLVQENMPGTQVKKSAASQQNTDPVGPSSAQPAPITLMPLPKVPGQTGSAADPQPSDAVYADPLECLQPKARGPEALYVDPASVLPVQPPGTRITPSLHSSKNLDISPADSVYSEVFDKISLQNSTNMNQSVKDIPHADEEPIYTEVHSEKKNQPAEKEKKTDKFSHLYAQVRKPSPRSGGSSPSSSPSVCDTAAADKCVSDQIVEDVIYENLGVI